MSSAVNLCHSCTLPIYDVPPIYRFPTVYYVFAHAFADTCFCWFGWFRSDLVDFIYSFLLEGLILALLHAAK